MTTQRNSIDVRDNTTQAATMSEAGADSLFTFVRLDGRQRLTALGAAGGVAMVFALAAVLTPDARGLGTHEQLGLPPCMTAFLFNIPCPFCGMTTAFSHMAHGHLRAAFFVQPAGAAIFIVSGIGALVVAAGGLTGIGARLEPRPALYRTAIAAGLIILAAAWIYKLVTHVHGLAP